MFDCHVHSKFSADSELDMEKACKKAAETGLTGLAFTDHLDMDFLGTDEFSKIDFEYRSRCMEGLREKENGSIKVLKGIEVGIQPHVIKESQDIVKGNDFDYVLASVHLMDSIDPYKGAYYRDKTKHEAYDRYLREILFMIRNFKDFDNVGHFEYIIRCADYDDRTIRYNDHMDIYEEILKILIDEGKGFEINTGSFRDIPGKATACYDAALLRRYRELGGEIITLGSDAHSEEYIGCRFGYFRELLLAAGFRYEVCFEARKPFYVRL